MEVKFGRVIPATPLTLDPQATLTVTPLYPHDSVDSQTRALKEQNIPYIVLTRGQKHPRIRDRRFKAYLAVNPGINLDHLASTVSETDRLLVFYATPDQRDDYWKGLSDPKGKTVKTTVDHVRKTITQIGNKRRQSA